MNARLSAFIVALGLALFAAGRIVEHAPARELRVCADPNNLPFSNEREEGFENQIVKIVASDLGRTVRYVWWAQHRGFLRHTLDAGRCDVVMGVPAKLPGTRTTRVYYRSTYAFVTRAGSPSISSLDDARLRRLVIGVQMIGDDFANTPPAHALAARGLVRNIVGFSVLGDYRQPNPPARIVEAVADGTVDVAVAWGPVAGYFASRQRVPLRVTPVSGDDHAPSFPFSYDIAIAVRRDDDALLAAINRVIEWHAHAITSMLERYGVPLLTHQGTP